jgi:hypothetical protein
MAKGLGGDASSIGYKENRAVSGREGMRGKLWHNFFEYKAIKAAILEANGVTPCKMLDIGCTTSHLTRRITKSARQRRHTCRFLIIK